MNYFAQLRQKSRIGSKMIEKWILLDRDLLEAFWVLRWGFRNVMEASSTRNVLRRENLSFSIKNWTKSWPVEWMVALNCCPAFWAALIGSKCLQKWTPRLNLKIWRNFHLIAPLLNKLPKSGCKSQACRDYFFENGKKIYAFQKVLGEKLSRTVLTVLTVLADESRRKYNNTQF